MATVITSIAEGGGVGKTALCFNLGWQMASLGKKVLLIDLDAQKGNLSYFLGIEDRDEQKTMVDVLNGEIKVTDAILEIKENLYAIPGNENISELEDTLKNTKDYEKSLKKIIAPLKKKYDYIFIDVNPTPSLIHIVAMLASDQILIPSMLDAKSQQSTFGVIETYEAIKKEYNSNLEILAVVFNKFEGGKNASNLTKATQQSIEIACKQKKIRIAKTKIPKNTNIGETGYFNIGITEHKPRSTGSVAYKALLKELFGLEE